MACLHIAGHVWIRSMLSGCEVKIEFTTATSYA